MSKIVQNQLIPGCPSLSLHAEKGASIYKSRNKHKHVENQITNCGNNNVFQSKTLSKSRRLILFWQNMIISFLIKHIKITKFHGKTKSCQNLEGSCDYYHIF